MGRDVTRVCAGVTPPEVYPHLEVEALSCVSDHENESMKLALDLLPGNSTPSSPAWASGRSPGRTQCCTFPCKFVNII